jgi:calcineurin-like phosphoesterase family protein
MHFQIASDLHFECMKDDNRLFGPLVFAPSDALILAGDIDRIDRVRERFHAWPTQVLYVRGNHDSFFTAYESGIAQMANASSDEQFVFLNKTTWIGGGVRVIGCCLWTDFALLGRCDDAMLLAQFGSADYRCIRRVDGKPLSPQDTRLEHHLTIQWLSKQLKTPFDGKTVVVTHHAPHARSLDRRFGRQRYDAGFASDLSALTKFVHLWVHGHVHHSCDYRFNRCRVVCNPAGVEKRPNPDFDPAFIVKI